LKDFFVKVLGKRPRNSVVIYNNSDLLFTSSFEVYLAEILFGNIASTVQTRMFYVGLDGSQQDMKDVKETLSKFSERAPSDMGRLVLVTNYEFFHLSFYDYLLKLIEERRFNFVFSVKFGTKLPGAIVSRAFTYEWIFDRKELGERIKSELSPEQYMISFYTELSKERTERFKLIEESAKSKDKAEILDKVKDYQDLMFLIIHLTLFQENLKLEMLRYILSQKHFLSNTFKSAVLVTMDQL